VCRSQNAGKYVEGRQVEGQQQLCPRRERGRGGSELLRHCCSGSGGWILVLIAKAVYCGNKYYVDKEGRVEGRSH